MCGFKDGPFLRAGDSWEGFPEEVNHEGPAPWEVLEGHGVRPWYLGQVYSWCS